MYYNPNFGWYNDDFEDGFTFDWEKENLERISDV